MLVATTHLSSLSPLDHLPLDKTSIPPLQLDLTGRQRTNPFPWRGQFSPQLVEVLLRTFGPTRGTVLDPFAGVGTTLWEAARLGLTAVGSEINPTAVTMARSVGFIPLDDAGRQNVLREARRVVEGVINLLSADIEAEPLFATSHALATAAPQAEITIPAMLEAIETARSPLLRTVLTNVLVRVVGNAGRDHGTTPGAIIAALASYAAAVRGLPRATVPPTIYHADARRVPMPDGTVDLILTSPPYINVFNYHQNGRAAMESLGWDLLRVARSEFGANRKHRGNRFLTVVQYCLDIAEWLIEARRVLSANGLAIVVIGRESNVRGVAFANGAILAALAEAAGFVLSRRQERRFTTRFGETIIEDILHLQPAESAVSQLADTAREIAVGVLRAASAAAAPIDVAADLREAVREAATVLPSPIFQSPPEVCAVP